MTHDNGDYLASVEIDPQSVGAITQDGNALAVLCPPELQSIASAAYLHGAVYGCRVEVGRDGAVFFARCSSGHDCPKAARRD